MEEGIERRFSDEEFEDLKKLFSKSWVHTDLNLLDAGISVRDPHAFRSRLEGLFLSYVQSGEVTLNPGANELMELCTKRAIPMGICTNGTETYADSALQILGVRDRFDCVVGYETAQQYFLYGLARSTSYARRVMKTMAAGGIDIVTAYVKPGPLPWLITFSALRGDMAKELTLPVIVEDRVSNACGALQCHERAVAYVVRHYDNGTEEIPEEFKDRIHWVTNLMEVRDRLAKLID